MILFESGSLAVLPAKRNLVNLDKWSCFSPGLFHTVLNVKRHPVSVYQLRNVSRGSEKEVACERRPYRRVRTRSYRLSYD